MVYVGMHKCIQACVEWKWAVNLAMNMELAYSRVKNYTGFWVSNESSRKGRKGSSPTITLSAWAALLGFCLAFLTLIWPQTHFGLCRCPKYRVAFDSRVVHFITLQLGRERERASWAMEEREQPGGEECLQSSEGTTLYGWKQGRFSLGWKSRHNSYTWVTYYPGISGQGGHGSTFVKCF